MSAVTTTPEVVTLALPQGRFVALALVDGCYEEVASCNGPEPYEADFPFPVRVTPSTLVD